MTDRREAFRWGIVGAGAIARQFAADLVHTRDGAVGGVFSRTEGMARDFARVFGTDKVFLTLEGLLADPGIDAVYIATPSALHAPQALQAIAAGKPVLVEKPLATRSIDAEAVADAAAKFDVFVMEALWSRFLPAVEHVHKLLAENAIGTVSRVEAELSFPHPEQPGSRFYDPGLGGGAAFDLAVYPLSLSLMFFGKPVSVAGRWWAASTGVDKRTEFEVGFAGGIVGRFSCGFDREGENAFTVIGSKGALRIAPPFLKAQKVMRYNASARDLPLVGAAGPAGGLAGKLLARMPVPGRSIRQFVFPGNGLQFEAEKVSQAVRAGKRRSDVMPLADSVTVLDIIERVLSQPAER